VTYPLSSLVGIKEQLVVKYAESEDKSRTYANIVSLIRQSVAKKEAASSARVQRVIDAAKKKAQTKTGLSSRPATPRRRSNHR
jgi:hypothetical protein